MTSPARSQENARTSEQRVVSILLRSGLAVAVLFFLIGIGDGVVRGVSAAPPFALNAQSFSEHPASALAGVGVLVLASTPFVRVISLLLLWTKERDYRFAFVAAFVALVLASAILAGRAA